MIDKFFSSVGAIRKESFDMLKNLRAIKGENYARLVHSIILTDQMVQISEVFAQCATEESADTARELSTAQESMITKIMDYYIRSIGFSEAQIAEAFADAKRLMGITYDLVDRASELAKQGHVMGGSDA